MKNLYKYQIYKPFYETGIIANFVRCDSAWRQTLFDNGCDAAILEYKTLFSFLLDQNSHLLEPLEDNEEIGLASMVYDYYPRCWITSRINWPEDFPTACSDGEDNDTVSWATTLVRAEHIANVTVRADYHLCLSGIASRLIAALHILPRLWEAIAVEPRWWMSLAVLLQASDIYAEGLRHIIGNFCLTCKPLSEFNGYDLKDLRSLIFERREILHNANEKIRLELDRMSLSPYTIYSWSSSLIYTVLLRPRNVEWSPPKTRRQRVDFIARSIFAQWIKDLHQTQLSQRQGDDPCEDGRGSEYLPAINECCHNVEKLKFWG
jgi:hypothetical protein